MMAATKRIVAWKFIHPDLDDASRFGGVTLTPRGGIAVVENDDAVRQALLLLLSTVPGERVMRPDYGCDLHQLVFSPNDDTTAGLAIYYIRRAIETWEPRVTILKLDAGRSPERPERLDLYLEYQVKATRNPSQLTFSLDLRGEEV